jgi:hypothetical protein
MIEKERKRKRKREREKENRKKRLVVSKIQSTYNWSMIVK